jgi:hypothetical protein
MLRRSLLTLVCVALCGLALTASAQAAPRWFVKEAGAYVPVSDLSGLSEFMGAENVVALGDLQVKSNAKQLHFRPVSECLVKARQSIEDPPETSQPGRGEMEEFEVLCEKETGGQNAAQLYPCTTFGEQFEIRDVGNWAGKLEPDPSTGTRKSFENFGPLSLEVFCPRTKESAVYLGSLDPQAEIGRYRFLPESGEFTEPKSGMTFNLKGFLFTSPAKYQQVRAK